MYHRIQPAHGPKFSVLEWDLCNLTVLTLPLYKLIWRQLWTHTKVQDCKDFLAF